MSYIDAKVQGDKWIRDNYRMANAKVHFEDSKVQESEPFLNGLNEESISDSYERAKDFMNILANVSESVDLNTTNEKNSNLDLLAGYKGNYVICVTHAFF